jgi:uncharacterized membrane protein YdfJ with MMPL/SSD domain
MQFDRDRPRLGYHGSTQGFVVKALTVVGTGVVLAGAIALSIVLFTVALAAMLIFGSYFWWKLRQLRRQPPSRFAQGDVIEGVVVREIRTQDYRGGER